MTFMYVSVWYLKPYVCLYVYTLSFHVYNTGLPPRLSKTHCTTLSGRIQYSRVYIFLFVESFYMLMIGVYSIISLLELFYLKS